MPLFHRTTVEFRPPARPDASQPVDVYTASQGFFQTLGIPLLKGRDFELRDVSSIIVSQSLARAFWPRQDPIGKVLALPGGKVTVVGVVRAMPAPPPAPPQYGPQSARWIPIWRDERLFGGTPKGRLQCGLSVSLADPGRGLRDALHCL